VPTCSLIPVDPLTKPFWSYSWPLFSFAAFSFRKEKQEEYTTKVPRHEENLYLIPNGMTDKVRSRNKSDWPAIQCSEKTNTQEWNMTRRRISKVGVLLLIPLMALTVLLTECATLRPFTDVAPAQAQTLIKRNDNNPRFVLLDVRTAEEFDSGHLKGALNIDVKAPDFAEQIEKLDKSVTYLVYCLGGVRSARAMQLMQAQGFQKVYNLEGGLLKWKAANLPL